MRSKEIRDLFIKYFSDNGHQHVASSPVVPMADPTLLFTNAGMNQFKDVFLGKEEREYKRAVSSQKCIRAGGKHNDLDNVGFTARHHTFFEMLGNFSFGDYFKEEAIYFCWDLMHNIMKLPKDRLWVTVFKDDDEAITIWKRISGLPESRIVKLGTKDNFWSMGETGPCGPCSEILIDQGANLSCGPDCGIGSCDCDRFLELWNLVFMQFNRSEDGGISPLPKPSIDTGMGLERITAILQGVNSNFETDLILPIINAIEEISGKKHTIDQNGAPFRVIADHARCLAFALADGAYPSNEGRGYVLRKILRRGARFGLKVGLEEPFISKLVSKVSDVMGYAYPEIVKKQKEIEGIIYNEELRFQETLSDGMKRINEVIGAVKDKNLKVIPGDQIFKLYDTYGIPMDIIEDVAREERLNLDMSTFEENMERQRTMAKSAQKDTTGAKKDEVYVDLMKEIKSPVLFEGYETEELTTKVIYIIKNGEKSASAGEGDKVNIILQRTPFYAESGGQVGDTGKIISDNSEIEVINTFSPVSGLVVHSAKIIKGKLSVDEKVTAIIDKNRREEIRKHHSATHLLHYALRTVLGEHVRQAGSLVEPDRFRFDFTHFKSLTDQETGEIIKLVNDLIQKNIGQKTELKDIKQAREEGAMALFGEKYAENVRVVSFGDISKELCGGTHVKSTGEIGFMAVCGESSIASGVRRIEAVCGKSARDYYLNRDSIIKELCGYLRTSPEEIKDKVEKLSEDKKKLEKDIQNLKTKKGKESIDEILCEIKTVNGINLLVKNCGDCDKEYLRSLGDSLKNKLSSAVICLGAKSGDQIIFLVMVTQDLVKQGYHAGNIIKQIAQAAGGNGGGRPDMAQAGAKDVEKLDSALEQIYSLI